MKLSAASIKPCGTVTVTVTVTNTGDVDSEEVVQVLGPKDARRVGSHVQPAGGTGEAREAPEEHGREGGVCAPH